MDVLWTEIFCSQKVQQSTSNTILWLTENRLEAKLLLKSGGTNDDRDLYMTIILFLKKHILYVIAHFKLFLHCIHAKVFPNDLSHFFIAVKKLYNPFVTSLHFTGTWLLAPTSS